MSGDSIRDAAELSTSNKHTQSREPAHSSQLPPGSAPVLPVRRQNVACDACRGRKIRCNRQPGSAKCDNCTLKQLDCTAFYVASLKPKRRRDSGTNGNGNGHALHRQTSKGSASEDDSGSERDHEREKTRRVDKTVKRRRSSAVEAEGSYGSPKVMAPPHMFPAGLPMASSHLTLQTFAADQMTNLLRYMFSPLPVHHADFGYDDRMIRQCPSARTWNGPASKAHTRLQNTAEMMELASDLMETYFQIVHIRLPVLDPGHFKSRFRQPTTHPDGPPPHILLAIVLTFGALFSDHRAIVEDREECSIAMQSELVDGQRRGVRKRSRLVQMMMLRAREVAEVNKAFRVPSVENIQASLLLDALLGDNITAPREYRASWFRIAVDHLKNLGLNKESVVVRIENQQLRGCLVFAWWLACLGDAFASAFYRLKPSLSDDDYDVEQPTAPQGNPLEGGSLTPHPLGTLSEYLVWYSANHAQAKICRAICTGLWIPKVEANGIPLSTLDHLVQLISSWRDEHLSQVGVPTVWPSSWDFVAAVTSCAVDSNYHAMWVVLHHAIRDFGIKEEDRVISRSLVDTIANEALHGALRIAALASILTASNYLRLDPNLLFFAISEAGVFLSSIGRDEANACIAGMRQYGIIYEEAFLRADELEDVLRTVQMRQQKASYMPAPYLPVAPQERLYSARDVDVPPMIYARQTQPRSAHRYAPSDDHLRAMPQAFDAYPTGGMREQGESQGYYSNGDRR